MQVQVLAALQVLWRLCACARCMHRAAALLRAAVLSQLRCVSRGSPPPLRPAEPLEPAAPGAGVADLAAQHLPRLHGGALSCDGPMVAARGRRAGLHCFSTPCTAQLSLPSDMLRLTWRPCASAAPRRASQCCHPSRCLRIWQSSTAACHPPGGNGQRCLEQQQQEECCHAPPAAGVAARVLVLHA